MNVGYFSLFRAYFLSAFWDTMSDRCMRSYMMAYLSSPDDILLQLPLLNCTWLAKYEFSHSCYILSWKCHVCYKQYASILLLPFLPGQYDFYGLTVSYLKTIHIQARSQNCGKRIFALMNLSVCPHGTSRLQLEGFNEIWYLITFRKFVERLQVSLESDKNNRYFTWRPIYIFDHISLIPS